MIDHDKYASPEELKRLLSALFVVVGGLVLLALFAAIVVPGLRSANKPSFPKPKSPLIGNPGWLDPTDFPPARGYVLPPVDPKTVMEPTPELLAEGKALFARECAACHGDTGKGGGPAAEGMVPPPRDLTRLDGWKNGPGRPGIYKTLTEGLPGTSMAPFDALRPKARIALAHHVRSLKTYAAPSEDTSELEALAKSFASAGGRVPPRIPVKAAMAKLAAEYRVPPALRPGSPPPIHREALAGASWDADRAARTLRGTPAWRGSPRALARIAAAGAPANGFSVSCARYDAADWARLHKALTEDRR